MHPTGWWPRRPRGITAANKGLALFPRRLGGTQLKTSGRDAGDDFSRASR